MPCHFSYLPKRRYRKKSPLQQGDVLFFNDRTTEKVLGDRHISSVYCYIVTSQTCDLTPREGGTIKATPISIAPCYREKEVFRSIIEKRCELKEPGFRDKRLKREVQDTLRKIIQQNDTNLGYFYLHKDLTDVIAEASIAKLREVVQVPESHYSALVNSRVARLAPEFREQLGWSLANIFHRPATEDVDNVTCNQIIAEHIDNHKFVSSEELRLIEFLSDNNVLIFPDNSLDIKLRTLQRKAVKDIIIDLVSKSCSAEDFSKDSALTHFKNDKLVLDGLKHIIDYLKKSS